MTGAHGGRPEDFGRAFDDLEALQAVLDSTLEYASESLSEYRDESSGGWFRLLPAVQPKEPGRFSAASTATCLSFVRAAHRSDITPDQAQSMLRSILKSNWSSAGLDQDNPFTVSFLLEAIHDLLGLGAKLTRTQEQLVGRKVALLKEQFKHDDSEADGGISVQGYPPTTFVTFKAIRTLRSWQHRWNTGKHTALVDEPFPEGLKYRALRWAWSALHAESVRVASGVVDADAFELAYSILTITTSTEFDRMTPPQRSVIGYCLDQFFKAQREDGTWPRGRPLFHYPKVGAAYCFDYELLVALLADSQLRPILRRYLGNLRIATEALERSRFPLGRGYGWASGHLRQVPSAESWSTASVLHFCYRLKRLVADEVRETMARFIGQAAGEIPPARGPHIDGTKYIDSAIDMPNDESISLVSTLEKYFLSPLYESLDMVEHGSKIPASVPTSAILYGPPGTSKTQLADLIGLALGWPVLKIDPSHLLRQGQDRIHAETYRLFNMLQATERAVILLDEFDELVRGREVPGEAVSRMLTTSMLPKLTALSSQRKLVILLATNHLEMLDTAITRPGRFDMIVPVMPPTLKAKLARWRGVEVNYERLVGSVESPQNTRAREALSALTYSEFEAIAFKLGSAPNVTDFRAIAKTAEEGCTLRRKESDEKDWSTRIAELRMMIRIPGYDQ